MPRVVTEQHGINAMKVRELMATYKEAEDLINIGAYKSGANPKIDRSIKLIEPINEFLKQSTQDLSNINLATKHLANILG